MISPSLGRYTLPEAVGFLQAGLVGANLHQLASGVPGISKALHTGRLRYIRRDPRERWLTIREVWQNGGGDCEDLAGAVAAERTLQGWPSQIEVIEGVGRTHHAVVRDLRSGRLMDPSKTGGMGRDALAGTLSPANTLGFALPSPSSLSLSLFKEGLLSPLPSLPPALTPQFL